MNPLVAYVRRQGQQAAAAWNRFWFTPSDPATLAVIRICGGLMFFYTHVVWSLGLRDFFGSQSWASAEALSSLPAREWAWSYLSWFPGLTSLWIAHVAALVVLAMLVLGLFTRVVSVLAFLIVVSYANRAPGALFGLDDINAMLAMYMMLGPAGAVWSLDALLRRRREARGQRHPQAKEETTGAVETRPQAIAPAPSIAANIAIRLMQVHLCIIYLFSGMGKLRGDSWWDGTAIWGAIGNYEYQSIDLTWLAGWPLLINLLTHVTVFWEVFYIALIWPRATRPWMLLLAVPLHLGIGLFLGMMTFGLVMLIANLAFVPPEIVPRIFAWRPGQGRAGEEAGEEAPRHSAKLRRNRGGR